MCYQIFNIIPYVTQMKNGKSATKGMCPACGIKMFGIGQDCIINLINL